VVVENKSVLSKVASTAITYVSMNLGGSVPDTSLGSVVVVDSGTDRGLTLPTLATEDIGKKIGFLKLGIGRLTITAPTGVSIQDSGPAGTIYCDDGEMARLDLEVISVTQIGIVSGIGNWTTTD
jgi:hypothetical protein